MVRNPNVQKGSTCVGLHSAWAEPGLPGSTRSKGGAPVGTPNSDLCSAPPLPHHCALKAADGEEGRGSRTLSPKPALDPEPCFGSFILKPSNRNYLNFIIYLFIYLVLNPMFFGLNPNPRRGAWNLVGRQGSDGLGLDLSHSPSLLQRYNPPSPTFNTHEALTPGMTATSKNEKP